MNLYETIPVWDNVFHITYIQNHGAAFSILEGFRGFLIVLPIVVIVCGLAYIVWKRRKAHFMLLLSLSCIIGGGIGNLIDRIVYGHVIDYLDFRIFPVFNVADISVCVGCMLMMVYVFFIDGRRSDG